MPSILLIGAVGATAAAVEVLLAAYGHGTHLLVFLLMSVVGALLVGPRAGFVMLGAGAVGSAIASLAGFGPPDPTSKLVLQLGLYLGVGTTILLTLSGAIEALRRVPTAPPVVTQTLRVEALTPREREVLRLAAGGMSVRDIATLLVVSPNTVKTHLSHAYSKLDARNRSQAVRAALHCGCIAATDICPHLDEPTRVNNPPLG